MRPQTRCSGCVGRGLTLASSALPSSPGTAVRCIGTPLEPSPPPARMDFSSATTAMLFFCREGDSSLEDSEEWWLVATAVCLRRSRHCKLAVLPGPTKQPSGGTLHLADALALAPLAAALAVEQLFRPLEERLGVAEVGVNLLCVARICEKAICSEKPTTSCQDTDRIRLPRAAT